MDNSKFDDIIKSKLESHVNPSGPTGAEVSKLFDGLTNIGSTETSILVKTLIAATSVLVLTTIFFIYRTYILEEKISSLRNQNIPEHIINPTINQVSFSTDTLFWDSLNVITKRLLNENKSDERRNDLIAKNKKLRQSNTPFNLSPKDSQRFVNQIMDQLIASLEENPEILQELFAGIRAPDDYTNIQSQLHIDLQEVGKPPISPIASKEQLFTEQLGNTKIEALLKELVSEQSSRVPLQNIMTGLSPETSEDDRIELLNTSENTESLNEIIIEKFSHQEQIELLAAYLKYDPVAVSEAASIIKLDSTDISALSIYANEKKIVQENIAKPKVQNITETRIKQFKENKKSWWLSGGLGLGSIAISPTENSLVTSITTAVEFKPNQRFGFSFGADYHHANGEAYDLINANYSEFEYLTTGQVSDLKEIKVSLDWMDIPLVAKVYILPDGKINPFVTVSMQARIILNESYTLETNQSGALNSEFESDEKFAFPTYGVGTGLRFKVGTKLDGAIRLQKSLGGKKMGPLDIEYNTLKGQASLFYRLD